MSQGSAGDLIANYSMERPLSYLLTSSISFREALALLSKGWGDEEALDDGPLNPMYNPDLYR